MISLAHASDCTVGRARQASSLFAEWNSMKLSLVVLTPGKMEGKAIPITVPQFVIGRDPQCNLRPASALVSKRHCVLTVRDTRIFVRDFDSTNGTRINDRPVKGEQELYDQ